MSDVNKIIGKNLLALRKQNKLTQLELAEKFNYSDKSISKWEAGESLPSIEVLCDLANFYNVELNDLVNENFVATKSKTKKFRDRFLPAKLIITLLAVSVIWLCATIVFVTLQLVHNYYFGLVFLWAVPLSCIVLIVFNSIWGKAFWLFPILTVMLWSAIAGIHLQVLSFCNIWPIYFLGIPLQVAIVLWSALIKKPASKKQKKHNQNEEDVKKENKKAKKLKKQKAESEIEADNDEFGYDFINNKNGKN